MGHRLLRGYRFNPSKLDLLYYLEEFVKDESVLDDQEMIIVKRNPYEENEWPGILFSNGPPWCRTMNDKGEFHKKETLYLITKLVPEDENGKRIERRTAGLGTWMKRQRRREVKDNNEIKGFYRIFEYEVEQKNDGDHGRFRYLDMYEYFLSPTEEGEISNDYVLRSITRVASEAKISGERRVQEVQETAGEVPSNGSSKQSSNVQFPNGFRFNPTNEELLFYLNEVANGNPLPENNGVIIKVDKMYGGEENMAPWRLFGDNRPWQKNVNFYKREFDGKESLYLVTQLIISEEENKKFILRTAGPGTWKKKESMKEIKNKSNRETIGFYQRFKYKVEQKIDGVDHGRVRMGEFRLSAEKAPGMGNANVLCIMKRSVAPDDSNNSEERRVQEVQETAGAVPSNGFDVHATSGNTNNATESSGNTNNSDRSRKRKSVSDQVENPGAGPSRDDREDDGGLPKKEQKTIRDVLQY